MVEEREGASVRRVQPSEQNPNRNEDRRRCRSNDPDDNTGLDRDKDRDEDGKSGDSEDSDGQGKKKWDGKPGEDKDNPDGKGKDGKDGKSGRKDAGQDEDEDGDGKKSKKKKKGSLKKRLKQIQTALAAGRAMMQGMYMAQMLLYLKSLMQAIIAVVQAAAAAVASAVAAVIQTVVTVVTTALGVSAAVALGGVVGLALVAVILVSVVVGGMVNNVATRDDGQYDCNTNIEYMSLASEFTEDVNENMTTNAKKVYAILKAYGLSDIQIAGILGNWKWESYIDATSVAGVPGETFTYPVPGTKKFDAWQGYYHAGADTVLGPALFRLQVGILPEGATDTMPNGTIYSAYGLVTTTNEDLQAAMMTYRDTYPSTERLPIGMAQWKDERNERLLNFATAVGMPWYLPETQVLFMIFPSSDADPNVLHGDFESRVNWIAGWAEESTPEAAAENFCTNWEGTSYASQRGESAREWYNAILTWKAGVDYDPNYAQSLINMIKSASLSAADRGQSSGLRACSGLMFADNSSAAAAAVTFAWGPGEETHNLGTDCWQHIHTAIIGDSYKRSCDRTVAGAIKWSGTDSDYRNGAVAHQYDYLLASPRWQRIDWHGDTTLLMPGDVLILDNKHTAMYVGTELIRARFGTEYNGIGTSDYCIVEGSLWKLDNGAEDTVHSESPHVDKIAGFSNYDAFRCIQPYNGKSEWTALTCVS